MRDKALPSAQANTPSSEACQKEIPRRGAPRSPPQLSAPRTARSAHSGKCVRIGYGLESPGAVQMIGVMKPFGTLIVHAMTPPQKSVLEELGIPGRR